MQAVELGKPTSRKGPGSELVLGTCKQVSAKQQETNKTGAYNENV